MVKKSAVLALVLLLGISSQAHALLGPDISVGLRVGLASFSEDELSSAPVVGVMAGLRQNNFGLELSVDWIVADVENGVKLGEITTIPIMLTGQYHILPKVSPIDPYLGAGVGFLINSFEAEFGFDEDIDPTVGFHLNAGVNAMVSTALALTVDARFIFAETDVTHGSVTDEVSQNAVLVTGGIKYFLPN